MMATFPFVPQMASGTDTCHFKDIDKNDAKSQCYGIYNYMKLFNVISE